jgi:hypothetical protein
MPFGEDGNHPILDIVTLPGYAHAGQYQSMSSFTPSLRKDGLNHNMLVLLNKFQIGLE